jgi:hypothetical protein
MTDNPQILYLKNKKSDMIEEMEKVLFTDAISIRSFMRMSLDLHKDHIKEINKLKEDLTESYDNIKIGGTD